MVILISKKIRQIFSLLEHFFGVYQRRSYSQSGEDRIIEFIFKALKIKKIVYLDIGAHHPSYINNTFLFYKAGHHGVCVEPDPDLSTLLSFCRPKDLVLNVGVGRIKSEEDFYIMSIPSLNTFSKEEADRYVNYGNKVKKIVKIKLLDINEILLNNFKNVPNFISIDCEGLELDVLNDFNFKIWRPEIFCVETLTYSEDKSETKLKEIITFMEEKGYMVYADTYINTIFVDRNKWMRRND